MTCPVVAGVSAAAARRAGATAIVGHGCSITYRQLWDDVLAWRVRLGGDFPPNTIVAVPTMGSVDLPAAFLGIRAAGLVPLLVDTLLPRHRRDAFMAAARPVAVLNPAGRSIEPLDESSPHVLDPAAGYVVFSSGTEGPPKGIVGSSAGLMHFLDWELRTLALGEHSRVALLTSPSFDVVLRELLLALVAGARLHVAEPRVRTDPAQILPWLADEGVDVVHPVPSLTTRWVSATPGVRVESLRWSLFAGEPLHARHVARWREVAPESAVLNLYGPSETTLAKFWHRVEPVPRPGIQPVGKPLPGTVLRQVRLPGPGDVFRVEIDTSDGSLGYLPDTAGAEERARLVRRDGRTRFTTQDRARLTPDALLLVEGRLDSLVKRRGVLFDTARLVALALDVPEVEAAYALQIRADTTGDIVLAVAGPVSQAILTRRLRRELGQDMPDEVVVVKALPLLPHGKVDRRRLLEMLESRPLGRPSSQLTITR